jgi:pilus assembly protein CpaF
MLQAMNTGHEGSLSTCHANSPDDALRRIETMVLMGDVQLPLAAVREQVHASLDVVVHLARLPDGRRQITAIAEVAEAAHRDARTHLVADGERVLRGFARVAR